MMADTPIGALARPLVSLWTARLGRREQVTVDAGALYTFAEAMPGLPGSHRYALLSDGDTAPLEWLQSLDEWEICLPVLDLAAVTLPGYEARVLRAAGAESGSAESSRIVLVTRLGRDAIAVNLLAPVVLDPCSGTGRQLILDGETGAGGTPIRQALAWDPLAHVFSPAC